MRLQPLRDSPQEQKELFGGMLGKLTPQVAVSVSSALFVHITLPEHLLLDIRPEFVEQSADRPVTHGNGSAAQSPESTSSASAAPKRLPYPAAPCP